MLGFVLLMVLFMNHISHNRNCCQSWCGHAWAQEAKQAQALAPWLHSRAEMMVEGEYHVQGASALALHRCSLLAMLGHSAARANAGRSCRHGKC